MFQEGVEEATSLQEMFTETQPDFDQRAEQSADVIVICYFVRQDVCRVNTDLNIGHDF